ncbi:hypothetical protein [Flagellimonas onchidii]|uniref:hypothetical protein n=1 Tax=Flagellimonas onchidii TaxID=2562684 RepID=UPI0010A67663|nr:hypothetical protein [Allomuricauda onchidii]
MTWKEKYSENKKLIALYDSYLAVAELTFDSRLRPMTEIGRLSRQNKYIGQMPVSEFHKDANDHMFKTNWMS